MTKIIDSTNLGYLISKMKSAFWPKSDVVQIGLDNSPTSNSDNLVKSGGVYSALADKQDTLVSGTSIKTVNNESLLGSGNITISGGSSVTESTVSGWGFTKNEGTLTGVSFNGTNATVTSGVAAITATIPTTLDQISDGSTRKLANYLPLSGGTMDEDAAITLVDSDQLYQNSIDSYKMHMTDEDDGFELMVDSSLPGIKMGETGLNTYASYTSGGIAYRPNNPGDTYNLSFPSKNGTLAVTSDIGKLNTNNTTAQTVSSSESLGGTIKLHKISKTGNYSDLLNRPDIPVSVITFGTQERYISDAIQDLEYTNLYEELEAALDDGHIPFIRFIFEASSPDEHYEWYRLHLDSRDQNQIRMIPVGGTGKLLIANSNNTYSFATDTPITNLQQNSITGVSFNGTSATVSNHVASITATIPAAVTESTVSGWGFTKNAGTLTGVKVNGSNATVTSGVADIGTVITSETQLSKGTTTGSGNAVTDISVSNHQITLTKGSTFLTSHQSIKTINNQTITGTGNVTLDTLPTVSSSDNGKILQVVNGAWTLVSPVTIYSGSGEPNNSMGNNGDIYLQT